MEIYFPIAGVSQDALVLIGIGLAVGFLSGMLGVGGGFLLTPVLIFLGVPVPIAVGTSANELVGASCCGLVGPLRRGHVDLKMGGIIAAGGVAGSLAGTLLFGLLRRLGQIDLVVSLSYVILLGSIGI